MNIRKLIKRQRRWSIETFGSGNRTEGVLRHIEREIAEVRAQPQDLEEWIDLVLLALDGAWRTGASPKQIMKALVAKQDKNFKRKWHPASDDQPAEHIKE